MRYKIIDNRKEGQQRIIKKYLFLPKRIGDERRWLERASIKQTLYRKFDVTCGAAWWEWIDAEWVDNTDTEDYDPYCKVCTGCGESGCCSAIYCEQSEDGAYCETYLRDLKFAYLMYNDTYELLRDDEESKKMIGEIFDKNWDLIYKTT